MDIITVIVGIVVVIMSGAANDNWKRFLKIIGALLILIGGVVFVVSFFQGYNAAIQYRLGK